MGLDIDVLGNELLNCINFKDETSNKKKGVGILKPSFEDLLVSKGFIYKNFDTLLDIIKADDRRLGVISCAGSGKTVTLLNRLAYQLYEKRIDPTKTVVCSFLSLDASRLKSKFANLCRKLGIPDSVYNCIRFGTIHSILLEVIRSAGIKWDVIDGGKRRGLIRRCAGKLVKSSEDIMNLENLFSYVENKMCDLYSYCVTHIDSIDLDIPPEDILLVYEKFKTVKKESKVLDFDDMQTLVLQGLQNSEGLVKYCNSLYTNFYIDEFQDISTIQYEILKYFWRGDTKQTFVIGDDDQSIYSWRGGDVSIFAKRIQEDFGFVFKNLSVNYRCGSNIVNFTRSSILKNKLRFEKDIMADSDRGGVVRVLQLNSESDMDLAVKTWEFIEHMGGFGDDSGVLVRETKHAIPLTVLLATRGVPMILGNDMMTLKNNKIMSNILDLIRMTRGSKPMSECTTLLRSIIGYKVREIGVLCERLPDLEANDIKFSAPKLLPYYFICKSFMESDGENESVNNFLHELSFQYGADISMYNPKIGSMILSFFDVILYIFNNYLDSSKKTLQHLFFALDEIEEILLMSRSAKQGVEVKTIHSAKGRGWETVLVFNDSMGYMPARDDSDIEEERRLHYVALTRAKQNLYVATKQFGPFLQECDMLYAKVYDLNNEGLWGTLEEKEKPSESY